MSRDVYSKKSKSSLGFDFCHLKMWRIKSSDSGGRALFDGIQME
jgi:hypothetical protein